MKCVLVGLGSMGLKHYNILKQMPEIDVVITVDVANGNGILPDYSNISSMLKKEQDIDFAIIATPTILHKEIAIELIEAGINVLIEKPITDTVKDAEEVLSHAQKNNVKIAVGHIERFNPAIKILSEELKSQTVINCNITRISPYPSRITDVGIKLDLAIHDIDLLRFITKQEIVSCHCSAVAFKEQREDTANFLCKMSGGSTGMIFNSWLSPIKKRNIEILTNQNYYNIDLIRHGHSKYIINGNTTFISNVLNAEGNALENELKSFINYVKTNNITELCTARDAMMALKYVTGD